MGLPKTMKYRGNTFKNFPTSTYPSYQRITWDTWYPFMFSYSKEKLLTIDMRGNWQKRHLKLNSSVAVTR